MHDQAKGLTLANMWVAMAAFFVAVVLGVYQVVNRSGFFPDDIDGAVAAAVIHDNDFLGDLDSQHVFEELPDGGLLVVNRDDDGKFHPYVPCTVHLPMRQTHRSTIIGSQVDRLEVILSFGPILGNLPLPGDQGVG